MGSDNAAFTSTVKGAPQAFITLDERLKAMDAMAVDMEVLSINPFWYRKERDLAAEIVRVQNDKLAELCASKPEPLRCLCVAGPAVSRPGSSAA